MFFIQLVQICTFFFFSPSKNEWHKDALRVLPCEDRLSSAIGRRGLLVMWRCSQRLEGFCLLKPSFRFCSSSRCASGRGEAVPGHGIWRLITIWTSVSSCFPGGGVSSPVVSHLLFSGEVTPVSSSHHCSVSLLRRADYANHDVFG